MGRFSGSKNHRKASQVSIRRFAQQSSAFATIHAKEDQFDCMLDNELKEKQHKPNSTCQKFRIKGKHALHSRVVLAIVVFLCVVDCILVIGELILDMHAIKEAASSDHGAPHTNGGSHGNNTMGAHGPDMAEHDGSGPAHNITRHRRSGSNPTHDGDASANGHEGGEVHEHSIQEKVAHALHYASITILAILVVETSFKIFFEGKEFLKKKIEMFDAFVVIVSFVLDLAFLEGITTLPIQESAYILSFILPWRVIRVVNSLVVAVLDHEHFKLLLVYKSKKYLKKQMDDMREDIHVVRKQLHAVKALCLETGTEEWVVNKTIVRIASQFTRKEKCALSSFASFTAGAVINEKRGIKRIPKKKEADAQPKSVDQEAKKILSFATALSNSPSTKATFLNSDQPKSIFVTHHDNGEATTPNGSSCNRRPLSFTIPDSDVEFADDD